MRPLFAVIIMALGVVTARADEMPPEVERHVADAGLRGTAQVSFLAFPIYTAQLWTPARNSVDQADRFALTLTYKRGFRARSLAGASISEIARMEDRPEQDFSDLEQLLLGCFADVAPEDRITGVSAAADEAEFFLNGEQTCRVTYPNLRDRFFGIWLGDNTRDPEVTAQILGQR